MFEKLLSFGEYFSWFIGIVWVLAAMSNKNERSELKGKVSALITAPTVYESAPESKIDLLYPRKTLETVAQGWKDSIINPVNTWFVKISESAENLKKGLLPENANGWKIFNYFFLFLLFCGYLYTDVIYVANTLEFMKIVKGLDPIFRRYEIAVAFGSLVSIVVGGLIAKDVFGEGSFSDWGLKKSSWTIFGKIFSIVLMVSGMYVVASLGAARFGGLVPTLPEGLLNFLDINGVLAANVITAVNAAIATALIADDSIEKGAKVLALIIISLMIAILWIIIYIINIIISTVIFFVDVLFRLFLVIKDIAIFLAFTPLDEAIAAVKSSRKK